MGVYKEFIRPLLIKNLKSSIFPPSISQNLLTLYYIDCTNDGDAKLLMMVCEPQADISIDRSIDQSIRLLQNFENTVNK